MRLKCILFLAVLFAGALALGAWDADAARFGGGKSFGGGASMSKPAPAPAAPGVTRGATGAAPGASRFGGMGGMIGGLLAGSLLGSLLFGGAFQGGGFMDILLIGLLIFFAFKLFSRFRRPAEAAGPSRYQAYQTEQAHRSGTGMDWGQTRGQAQDAGAGSDAECAVPAGFDVEEFLRGAKMAYTRLQASWDKRDLDDIAQFAGQAILQEVRAQAKDDPAPSTTEILLLNARLLSVSGDARKATVFFDVLLREDPKAQSTTQAREIWHFMRDENASWKLDGIQQVEG